MKQKKSSISKRYDGTKKTEDTIKFKALVKVSKRIFEKVFICWEFQSVYRNTFKHLRIRKNEKSVKNNLLGVQMITVQKNIQKGWASPSLFQYFTFVLEEFWKFATLNSSSTRRELLLKTSVTRTVWMWINRIKYSDIQKQHPWCSPKSVKGPQIQNYFNKSGFNRPWGMMCGK